MTSLRIYVDTTLYKIAAIDDKKKSVTV